ncbi:L,D-transpeptidase family protein [Salipiger sp. P9]|uniref:L,D-transpeptidase family protein n=1 Tax=Salipiger pentaromativorans TaxID=2943193 RepID=UPI002157ED5E|nr:L,D-transpeptidase family protein [Salipiger pentaromativorans]MCR8547285.1 L,D-transpeptidase family protein [Salipiger pentaromativorans]
MTNSRRQIAVGVKAGMAVALAAGWILAAAPQGAAAQTLSLTAYKQAVAESLAEDEGLAAFYRERGFEPLWTAESPAAADRRAALIAALSGADAHGLPAARYDLAGLMAQMRAVRGDRARGLLEVELSQVFLRYAHDLNGGLLDGRRVDSGIKREPQRLPSQPLLEALADQDPRTVFRDLAPKSPEYTRLMREKLTLEHRIAHGGWGETIRSGKLEPGQSGAAVVALRDRLIAMGYLGTSLSARYDEPMRMAVAAFQDDHGLEADGVAGAATLSAINIAPEERLKSVLVAMERERWLNLPDGLGTRHILVNLTDFHARIIDAGKVSFETRSVVGHQDPDRRTPEFSDVMEFMVINPSWYVPRSIIVNEYLPLLRRNPGAAGHLQITDSRGRVVNRSRGFSQYSAASFPYAMRQPPGPRNALGQVKFMFPNKYNIYLHDTPSKSLFDHTQRTYSHGCVRLSDPKDFAYALLAAQTDDPVGFFQSRLRSGAETRVNLDAPVPVHLIYRTAFTKAKGKVNYRNDVYGRDAKLWNALSAAGVALAAPRS